MLSIQYFPPEKYQGVSDKIARAEELALVPSYPGDGAAVFFLWGLEDARPPPRHRRAAPNAERTPSRPRPKSTGFP